jgi:hypothetical protein
VRRWIELDRANGYELVYAVDGRYVLSLTGTSEATIRVFEAVANGLSFEIEGNSIVGPNPAMDPHETRRLWRAKSLHELSLVELSLRIGALGGDVASASVESPPWLIHAGRGVERAQLTFHGGPAGSTEGGPQSLARLRKAARPFSYARDGDTLLVCEGALCASADFLRDALEGTHAEVVAEPPYR